MKTRIALAAVAVILANAPTQAQDKLKIGIIATLSGPPAVLGQQLRNGFNLALKALDGKLGGREAEVLVADDELKPDLAVTKVRAFVERDTPRILPARNATRTSSSPPTRTIRCSQSRASTRRTAASRKYC